MFARGFKLNGTTAGMTEDPRARDALLSKQQSVLPQPCTTFRNVHRPVKGKSAYNAYFFFACFKGEFVGDLGSLSNTGQSK